MLFFTTLLLTAVMGACDFSQHCKDDTACNAAASDTFVNTCLMKFGLTISLDAVNLGITDQTQACQVALAAGKNGNPLLIATVHCAIYAAGLDYATCYAKNTPLLDGGCINRFIACLEDDGCWGEYVAGLNCPGVGLYLGDLNITTQTEACLAFFCGLDKTNPLYMSVSTCAFDALGAVNNFEFAPCFDMMTNHQHCAVPKANCNADAACAQNLVDIRACAADKDHNIDATTLLPTEHQGWCDLWACAGQEHGANTMAMTYLACEMDEADVDAKKCYDDMVDSINMLFQVLLLMIPGMCVVGALIMGLSCKFCPCACCGGKPVLN